MDVSVNADEPIQKVYLECFRYVEYYITIEGGTQRDVDERFNEALVKMEEDLWLTERCQDFATIKIQDPPQETSLIALNDSECWRMTKKDEIRLSALETEMKKMNWKQS